uniref:Uncharacterized protein n=1 Tax=viral metagenome TaxID=1070528 RepID=A0A6M3IWD4_9ZZZZ
MLRVIDNFRNEDGDFSTDIKCDICNKQSSVYISLNTVIICKSCLSEMILVLDSRILNNTKENTNK